MESTILLAKVLGPVLLIRGVSLLFDRRHFATMLEGLEREVSTVSFSLFPIALLMACIALAILHDDRSSLAALLIQAIAWGGMAKATALIIAPGLVVKKVKLLGRVGFLNVVLASCLLVGGYFTWFGYQVW